jgi:membrane fusion protein (multidrug efflux system)
MIKLKSSIIVLTAALFLSPAVLSGAENPAAQKMPPPKADIYVVPNPVDLPINLEYPAQIQSFQDVKVYSRVLGVLEEKHFTEGEKIHQGDLLFKIEDDIYKARVEAAEAALKMNEATYQNAKRDWDRIKKLHKTKAVSDEKRDVALFAYEKALSSISFAKAELSQAKIDLEYTNVKASISGTTGLKLVDVGDLVTQNPPTALITITQNDKVYIDFSMPLSDYKNIKNGLWRIPEDNKIEVTLQMENKTIPAKGYVDFIDANIQQNTSTVKMRAVVDNSDNFLMAGNFIRVSLQGIVQKNVLTIPQKALLQNPQGTIVLVEQDGIAGVKPVIIGKESGDKFIVAGGPVQSGDRVIVNNFFRVKPGQPLTVDKIINQ